MIKVRYKGKIWKVLIPKDLEFPPNCIRNVLIERGDQRVITNIKELKVIGNFKDITDFF